MPTYQGGCHCGRIRFEVTTTFERVVDCNCSICSKKGFLHLIVDPENFRLLSPDNAVALYQFNTKTAKHYFCRHCGIHPFIRPRLDPGRWAVNVRCLEDVDLAPLKVVAFDGSNWEAAAKAFMAQRK